MATTSNSNLRTFTLIWLDSSVNSSEENLDTQVLLRKINDCFEAFDSTEKCLEYIQQTVSDENIVLIVNGRLGQEIVPRIQPSTHIIAIYVYCSDKKRNEEWAKHFIHVTEVIVDLKILISRIRSDQIQHDEYQIDERFPFSVFHPKLSSINDEDFFHFQLLIDCLSRMKSNDNDKNHFLSLCKEKYKDNEDQMNVIAEFESTYSSDRAIWWFTRDCFLRQSLNHAFDILDVNFLYDSHFFLSDIHQQLNETKCSSPICTYRSQLMSNSDIELLKSSIGGFISINTFLSTIPNRQRAITILHNTTVSNDFKCVLFEINADSHLNDIKPFTNITAWNYFHGMEIILFMAGTIFHQIEISEEDDILIIRMEVCRNNHRKIKTIIDQMKSKCDRGETNLLSFAHILSKMKRFDDAEKYFHQILHDLPHDYHSVANCYQGLGNIAMEEQDYDLCLQWYRKALETNQLVLREEDPEIASRYSDLASVHVKKGELNEALEFYTQAVQIWIRALGKEHPKVAGCYKDMACIFQMKEQYPKALEYFQKALIIRQKNLSCAQFDLAKLHNHIADVNVLMDEINEAFRHYDLACSILIKSYSSKHPDVLLTLRNMGFLEEKLGNLKQALVYYTKIAAIYRQSFSSDHSNLLQITQDIERVSTVLNKETSLIDDSLVVSL
ncbi:hypothetical protein I4U23_007646 [Adineta vaga]|nr:hypothetical protein I4U23_007646 [Adineta vaga]